MVEKLKAVQSVYFHCRLTSLSVAYPPPHCKTVFEALGGSVSPTADDDTTAVAVVVLLDVTAAVVTTVWMPLSVQST